MSTTPSPGAVSDSVDIPLCEAVRLAFAKALTVNINPVTLAELEAALNGRPVTLHLGTDAAVNALVAGAASGAAFAARIGLMGDDETIEPATLDAEMAAIEPDPVKWAHFLMGELDRLNAPG